MPLFVCDGCKCVDNTATSDFYLQARIKSPKRLCTFCRTGTWHDKFPRGPGQVEVRGVTFDYERIDTNGGNPPIFKLTSGTWSGHQDIYGRIT